MMTIIIKCMCSTKSMSVHKDTRLKIVGLIKPEYRPVEDRHLITDDNE
jgi:hypothetical protein